MKSLTLTLLTSLLVLSSVRGCQKSAQCDDNNPCTIDFCEIAYFRCVNIAPTSSCTATHRLISQDKLVNYVNKDQFTRQEMVQIIDSAIHVLRDYHPHRLLHLNRLKVDPVEHLNEFKDEILDDDSPLPSNLVFHDRMKAIFVLLVDRHTTYRSSAPLNETTAFLPFAFQPYYVDGDPVPVYMLTDTAANYKLSNSKFVPGVKITTWDGEPMHDVIVRTAKSNLGANEAAKFSNAIHDIRVRPLSRQTLPPKSTVVIEFSSEDGVKDKVEVEWLFSVAVKPWTASLFNETDLMGRSFVSIPEGEAEDPEWMMASALQFRKGHGINRALEPSVMEASDAGVEIPQAVDIATETSEPVVDPKKSAKELAKEAIQTGKQVVVPVKEEFKEIFDATVVPTKSGPIGWLRIYAFARNYSTIDQLLVEFEETIRLLPKNGIVLDLRGNLGGFILVAKTFTELLTDKPFEFVPYDTRATPLWRKISASESMYTDLFEPFRKSINTSIETGDPYTGTLDFIPPIPRKRSATSSPLLLVADGSTYSAGDMFVSLYKDNDLAPVVTYGGNNIGAGGSAVIRYTDLTEDFPDEFPPLAGGVSFTTSFIRTLRGGKNRGAVLENFGIEPDMVYMPTLNDKLNNEQDMFEKFGGMLKGA